MAQKFFSKGPYQGYGGAYAAADVVREAMMPFADWGFMGAVATDSRRTGGTDSTSFNMPDCQGLDWRRIRLIMVRLRTTPIWTPTSASMKRTLGKEPWKLPRQCMHWQWRTRWCRGLRGRRCPSQCLNPDRARKLRRCGMFPQIKAEHLSINVPKGRVLRLSH